MGLFKSLIWTSLLFLFLSSTFSLGVYDDLGNFNYYTNKVNPLIFVNITSPAESITIVNSTLIVNTVKTVQNIGMNLNSGDSFLVNQNFSTPISILDNISFEVIAVGLDGKRIIPMGNPTKFLVKLDNITPTLLFPTQREFRILDQLDLGVDIGFSELISSYTVSIGGKLTNLTYNNSNKVFLKDYKKNFRLIFPNSFLTEGNNNISLSFQDIAGNKNTINFNLFYKGPPLKINLITSKEDSTLKYFFDKKYQNLFQKTIFSSQQTFTLKINTSKPANCYFSQSLLSNQPFTAVVGKTPFQTNGNLIHTLSVTAPSKIWVACQNPIFPNDDIAYLNEELLIGNNLIDLKLDSGVSLAFDKTFPDRELTTNTASVQTDSNKRSVCFFKLDGSQNTEIATTNFIIHQTPNINFQDGNHIIDFSCRDVLNNQITKKVNFNVNSSKGVKIFGNFPIYTDSMSTNINFTVSEQVECKYSKTPNKQPQDFNSLNNITMSNFSGSFNTQSLNAGDNNFYVYCNKNGNINENPLLVVYDPNGPSLSNLSFYNNGIKSDFVSSFKQINFKFTVTSLTPMLNYFLEFTQSNQSILYESKTNDISLNFNLSEVKKVRVIGQNILGINSSVLEKKITFDLNKPTIQIITNGETFKINCFDAESGICKKVDYGLSKTNVGCVISLKYTENSSIDFTSNNYVCIKGFDGAGNSKEITKPLVGGFSNPNEGNNTGPNSTFDQGGNSNNNLNSNSQDVNNTDTTGRSKDPNDIIFSKDPNQNLPQDSGISYTLIGALCLILAGVSGGGYYAYKKGYLNKELEKFGIIKKSPNVIKGRVSNSKVGNNGKYYEKSTGGGGGVQVKNNPTTYDEHLNKLNKFIDEKLNKNQSLFDKFDEQKHRGKVKGYKDTLIRKPTSKKVTQDDFEDEFYNRSKEIKESSKGVSKNDAEDFENFHKKHTTKSHIAKK